MPLGQDIPLYPEIDPFENGTLSVGGGHVIYWEQSGRTDGIPVVFLHGGPGSGATPAHRRFFDPAIYRIVILDQRGAGRSAPLGSLVDNKTAHLIDDLEVLRQQLRIERWLLFGGSWGSTLALAYGLAHPERCLGFVLRGIFLGRPAEIDWFLYGMRTIYPEAWTKFADFLPPGERGDLLAGYHRRLADADPAVHLPAARAWSVYEGSCSTLLPHPELVGSFAEDRHALGMARIEAHYFRNGCFIDGDEMLRRIDRIRLLPAIIVQGRYDIVCPIVTADALAAAWPEAEYRIVPDAGHSAMEPGIRSALIAATRSMTNRFA
ncbi:prolyl aminopeptidase [Oceanibaculum pacificum]|uniref:Proline iminopeptidase n=1 Tax=Oceanibaculum pacificum TaxID=580166 RepID=A0A154W6D1_9PROT|nr:prolyl aminopeptidase [Oceanibaculum pacificum]KZD09090.1 proline iminopeptidase [Oceanibaculum pacificum]